MDKQEDFWKQKDKPTKLTYIQPSVSADDILLDNCLAAKHQRSSCPSGAGVWRTPFSQHPTPTPSIQPIRIDIPVTRAAKTQINPPLMTFQSPSKLTLNMSQILKAKGNAHSIRNPANNIYACPLPAINKLPPLSLLSQQNRPTAQKSQVTKTQVGTTSTKHVSFQEPPTKQKQSPGPQQNKDRLQLSDPWKRDAQEKVEQQQRIHMVALLEQEVQELQAKAKLSAEENDRLRKLSLEWQFQKRLEEIQRRGDDDDEEEDEDLEMMMTIQQLGDRTQVMDNGGRCTLKSTSASKLCFWSFGHLATKQWILVFISILRSGEALSGMKLLLWKCWRDSKELLSPKTKTRQRQVDIYLYATGNVILYGHIKTCTKCIFSHRSEIRQSEPACNKDCYKKVSWQMLQIKLRRRF